MKRRGFLLAEENLKIVIAVICISFLIYFLTALYFNNVKTQNLQKAEQILLNSDQSVKSIIENLNEGDSEKVILENPKGWHVLGFLDKKPDSCSGVSCVCICEEIDINVLDRQVNECFQNGACLPVKDLKTETRVEIKNPKEGLTEIVIEKDSEGVSIREFVQSSGSGSEDVAENAGTENEEQGLVAGFFSEVWGGIRNGGKKVIEFFGGDTSRQDETFTAGVKA